MKYLVSIKTRFGNYRENVVDFKDEDHKDNYYNKVVSNGGKVIGLKPLSKIHHE